MTGSKMMRAACVVMAALCAAFTAAPRALAWNHTEIKWKHIETDHFSIHFHEGSEWSAREVARIAEEIYGPVTSFYDYEIDRVHITLFDKSDRAAGAAFFYFNRIDLDASDFNFHLRGTTDWLRNVLTHEFTHMVTIRSAMKMPRQIPAVYLQAITFEREKRPDVITGYPNFQASLPVAGEVLPNWFAEGLAQFQCPTSRNDIWDSHRDMLLRTAALSDRLLSIDGMGVFGKNSLESELVYNQGYSLVRYVSGHFGPDKLRELLEQHSVWYRIGFDGACRKVLGISSGELYTRWKASLIEEYGPVLERVRRHSLDGSEVAGRGYMNLYPVPGPDGRGIYFLSNRGRDYMSMDLVYQPGDDPEDVEEISTDMQSRPSVGPRGRLCYARRTGDNDYGYELDDIFVYDAERSQERRVTRGMRATDPSWAPDGSAIVAVKTGDGAEDLVVIDPESGEWKVLLPGAKGTRMFTPAWGERGILVSLFDGTSRDIVLVDPAGGKASSLVATDSDERDPAWDSTGEGIFYSSDRTGIFNIYHLDIDSGETRMLTDLLGGGFSPWQSGGAILFSSYGPEGYRINRLGGWSASAVSDVPADRSLPELRGEYVCRDRTADGAGIEYDYSALDEMVASAGNYGIKYTPIYIFPRLMYYDDKPRIGLTLDTRDYLDRQSLFAAGSINDDKEFNFQVGLQTRQFKPTFDLTYYFARKYYRYSEESLGDVQVRYDLWDAFFNCRLEFDEPGPRHVKELILQYNHGEYGLNINAWEAEDIDMELGWKYYKANEVSAIFNYLDVRSEVDSDINPRRGRRLVVEATRAWDELSSGAFEYNFKPIYDENDFGRYTVRYEEYLPLPFWSHSLTLYVRGGLIDTKRVDDFFDLFLGSRDGLRGYSYYSIGGKKNIMARGTWRFPIWRDIDRQIMANYFGSLYGALFIEAGKAWDEDEFDLDHNQKDAGFELRLKGFTFYNYPLAASFEGAYGFDEIVYRDPFVDGIVAREGKEWKFYGTVFFDF